MWIEPGTYALGPDTGRLLVRTGRRGAIAKVGHDLLIEVGAWGATVQLSAEPEHMLLELTADSGSMRVLEGTGGIQSLGENEKTGISQTIDQEVLRGTAIAFRSTRVTSVGNDRLTVEGDLELAGGINPISFDLQIGEDRRVAGTAVVKQSAWGMKPYTALFGTLKVADDVTVSIDAKLKSTD